VGKSCIDYVAMNGADIDSAGLKAGDRVRVTQTGESVELTLRSDDRLAGGCARVPLCAATARLGDLFGEISVERA
jgi:anaerobic selenocysteine-containing dehydrogenase